MPARMQSEISHLFDFVTQSGCRFNRNGAWHDTAAARSHMEMKYEYLSGRGLIDSAEAFIDNAASKSSMTGKDYLVQCPGSEPQASGAWLRTELTRFRQSGA